MFLISQAAIDGFGICPSHFPFRMSNTYLLGIECVMTRFGIGVSNVASNAVFKIFVNLLIPIIKKFLQKYKILCKIPNLHFKFSYVRIYTFI